MDRPSKQEKKKEKYFRVKKAKREQRRKRTEAKREERKQMLESMSEEERREFINTERAKKDEIQRESDRVRDSGIPILFDVSFSELMTSIEQGSLVNQICNAIGFQRAQESQVFKLICCSVNPTLKEMFLVAKSDKWGVHLEEANVIDMANSLSKTPVMLSPDAPDALEHFDTDTNVYIIGGLVDKTRKKAKSLEKAMAAGIPCYRLPIQETLDPKHSLVLNVNTVFEILFHKAKGCSWEEALSKGIPKRMLK